MSKVVQSPASSRERLASISHHFLSGSSQSAAQNGDGPLVIPILSVAGGHPFPSTRLKQALLERGRLSHVLNVTRDGQDKSHLKPSKKSHLAQTAPSPNGAGGGPARLDAVLAEARALAGQPDVILLPLTSQDVSLISAFGNALLGVPCNPEGLKNAFHLIKRLLAAGVTGTLGVTMVDAANRESAEMHFEKLADGAFRFADVDLVSYGYIPVPPAAHAPVDLLAPHGEGAGQTALDGVAILVAADLPPKDNTAALKRHGSAKRRAATSA